METTRLFRESGHTGYTQFGQRLLSVRQYLKLSPGTLSERIGCFPIVIESIEEGTIVKSDVLLGVVERLRTDFDILPEYFLIDCGDKSYASYEGEVRRRRKLDKERQSIVNRFLNELDNQ